MSPRPLALLSALALLTACPPAPTDCDALALIPGALTLGFGEESFTPVHEGDELPLTWGMQGGQHVWVGLRASGIEHRTDTNTGFPTVEYSLIAPDGTWVGSGYRGENMTGTPEASELLGDPLFLDYFEPPFEGALTLRATLTDTCGRTLEDEHGVVLVQ